MVPEIIDMELPIEGVFHNMAIIQIHKTYPGQALKVMNSLWGAGQMMFTKMMVVVDQHTQIHDYAALARYVSENVDPQQDIIIGQGPTDVLDHSCSKMAFGGKLGIDATRKLPEELRSEKLPSLPASLKADFDFLLQEYPEITAYNAALAAKGISLLLLSLKKTRKGHCKQLARSLAERPELKQIKFFLFLDAEVNLNYVGDSVWRFCNNADVKRDSLIIEAENDQSFSQIFIDGTRKTKEHDGFERDWPNVLVSTEETIQKIDVLWKELGLGPFIPSPSLRYKEQVYGKGAVAL
jgi:4-hydroxy-3-polyprenylbenzoate decarboxylase